MKPLLPLIAAIEKSSVGHFFPTEVRLVLIKILMAATSRSDRRFLQWGATAEKSRIMMHRAAVDVLAVEGGFHLWILVFVCLLLIY